ncbi:hypothetical protein OH781_30880 [Streptomyces sp. NBC_01550]|uniref:hypothetical protein n=1 Tax=Streptomyces TaxID=1883 RepID=UPI003396C24E
MGRSRAAAEAGGRDVRGSARAGAVDRCAEAGRKGDAQRIGASTTSAAGAAERSSRQGLGDAPQAAAQVAFLEGVHLVQVPAVGEGVDEVAGKEVDGEAAVLKDVVAMGGAVVGVTAAVNNLLAVNAWAGTSSRPRR